MKRFLTLTMAFLAALSLTAVARADVIQSPVVAVGIGVYLLLPFLLVGAVVGITVYLLRKYWKKKK